MQLSKSDKIIESLEQKDSTISFQKLKCWIKTEDDYNIHIFTMQLQDEEELLKIRDDLRDYLAIYFQSQTLEKDIERWNVYQVFFVEKNVSKDLKLKIEQDKFATRKLLIDNIGKELSDEEVVQELNSKIFQFELTPNEPTIESLGDVLDKDNIALFSMIEKMDGNIDVLLKQLENEQD